MKHFSEAVIPQPLFHRLEQIGFNTPTPIQAQAIPPALLGSDILGSAQTGTGKTGAYGIPLIAFLLNNTRGSGLVLLPTRELAMQVMKALQQFIGRSKLNTALLIGGEPMPKQFRQLKNKPRLIVGTPGRINDHLQRGTLALHDTNFLVLDEVDRMLDMGFGVQLEAIATYLTAPKRQTLMFSATLPGNIEKLANNYLTDPIRISVGEVSVPAANVKQEHVKLVSKEKLPRLLQELDQRQGSIIIFAKTKHGADNICRKIRAAGHRANALHGDLRHNKRAQVTSDFRNQKFRILVATDIAARGLDIPHIEHVINYDIPSTPEDYIHRIGRTARAGVEGEAISFLSQADSAKWKAIQRLLAPESDERPIHYDTKPTKSHAPKSKKNKKVKKKDKYKKNRHSASPLAPSNVAFEREEERQEQPVSRKKHPKNKRRAHNENDSSIETKKKKHKPNKVKAKKPKAKNSSHLNAFNLDGEQPLRRSKKPKVKNKSNSLSKHRKRKAKKLQKAAA